MACDNYFESQGIPYENAYQDLAVSTVRQDPDLNVIEKKELIICWFDETFGMWNGARYDLKDSRVQMAQFLKGTKYRTYEELLEDTTNGNQQTALSTTDAKV